MRILHIIHNLDPRSGGPVATLRTLAVSQAERGHHVTILATAPTSRGRTWFTDRDRLHVHLYRAGGGGRLSRRFGYSGSFRRKLLQLMQSPEPLDFVHLHGLFSYATMLGARQAYRAGIPYALRPAGGLAPWCLAQGNAHVKRALLHWPISGDLRRASFVHATSQREANDIQRLIPGARVVVIPPPIPMEAETPPSDSGCTSGDSVNHSSGEFLLFLSRLSAKKGATLLVHAFGSLARSHPSLHLVLAGNDEGEGARITQMLHGRGWANRVCLAGHVEGEAKQRLLAGARMLALPSRDENFAVVVAEAMAAGVPVLTCPGVDSHEHVDAARAGLTVARDRQAIAEGIRRLLAMDRDAMGSRGRAYIQEHLSPTVICSRLEEAYERHLR